MSRNRIRFIVEAALIAAMYAVLTIVVYPLSYGPIQVRFSEALTILPFFTPAAIPGLFVGCLTANILGYGIYDIIFGSVATLIAAMITRKIRKKYLVPLPAVIINAIVVPVFIISPFSVNAGTLPMIGTVALGEIIACYVLGYPLLLLLEKNKDRIFKSY